MPRKDKSYILWLPQGRLGNLIFQYQALMSLKPKNSSVFTLQNEFEEVFEFENDFTFIKIPSIFRGYIIDLIFWIIRKFVKFKLFGVITTEKKIHSSGMEIETSKIIRKSGFLSKIQVLDGFFQSPAYANRPLKFKNSWEDLSFEGVGASGSETLVAVHFRYCDYKEWSIFGTQGVVLPESYYHASVRYILEKIRSPIFIIFSDNVEEVPKHLFSGLRHVFYRSDHFSSDFMALSLCDHAIISCSTFAWWAAHLIKNQSKIVIAPKFWIGFKSSIWHPPAIRHPNYIYLDSNNIIGNKNGL